MYPWQSHSLFHFHWIGFNPNPIGTHETSLWNWTTIVLIYFQHHHPQFRFSQREPTYSLPITSAEFLASSCMEWLFHHMLDIDIIAEINGWARCLIWQMWVFERSILITPLHNAFKLIKLVVMVCYLWTMRDIVLTEQWYRSRNDLSTLLPLAIQLLRFFSIEC